MPGTIWRAGQIASPAVFVRPDDTLAEALATLQRAGYSRAPVYDGRQVTGALTARTWQRLLARPVDPGAVRVRDVQDPPLPSVPPAAGLAEVLEALERGPAVLVVAPGRPPGIITYVDVVRDAAPYLWLRELDQLLRALLDQLEQQAPPGGWLALLPPAHARRVRGYCQRDGGGDELDYLDLYDLRRLVEAGWQRWFSAWFAPLDRERVCGQLDAIRRARNDVAHMRPLSPGERAHLRAAVGEIAGALRARLHAAAGGA